MVTGAIGVAHVWTVEWEAHAMSTRSPAAELGGRAPAQLAVVAGVLRRLALYLVSALLTALLALPALWLTVPPFRPRRTLSMSATSFTAHNLRRLLADPEAIGALRGAVLLAAVVILVACCCGALAAVLLPRSSTRGADLLVYLTLLLCSVVAGTAVTMPLFLFLRDLNLIDSQLSVMLVLSGSLLPAVLFLLTDFVAALPRWNTQAGRGFQPERARLLARLTLPLARRGVVLLAVLVVVNVWGSLLGLLLPAGGVAPTADPVVLFTFAAGGGGPDHALVAEFTAVYSLPLVVMYLVFARGYGFRQRTRWQARVEQSQR